MRDDVVRLSFDISAQEHAMLKAACAEAMIPMKNFLHELVVKGIRELKEKQLNKVQKKSTSQSQESKFKNADSFAGSAKDEIEV